MKVSHSGATNQSQTPAASVFLGKRKVVSFDDHEGLADESLVRATITDESDVRVELSVAELRSRLDPDLQDDWQTITSVKKRARLQRRIETELELAAAHADVMAGQVREFLSAAVSHAGLYAHLAARSSADKTGTTTPLPWRDPGGDLQAAALACGVALKSDAELSGQFDQMWLDFEPALLRLAATQETDEVRHVHPVGAIFLHGVQASHGLGDVDLHVIGANDLVGFTRRPDACFFKRGQRGDAGFDAGSQKAAVGSVEWKDLFGLDYGTLSIDERFWSAINEAICDAELMLGTALPLGDARKPFFTTVIGDGVRCALLRLSRSPSSCFDVLFSPVFEFARADDNGGFTAQRDVVFAFFKLCVHALQLTASGNWTYECGWRPTHGWPDRMRVSEVIAGGDTVVFRFADATGGRKIAKVAGTGKAGVARLAREIEQRRLVADRAAAQEIDVARIFVPGTEQVLVGQRALVFDDVGFVSFESLVYTRPLAEVHALAALVWRDVHAELALLHKLGLAFGDVHVGNILISADQERAVLVDFESICAFGASLDGVLVRSAFKSLARNAGAASDLESLRFCVAWALDIDGFRTILLSAEEQWTHRKRAINEDKVVQILNRH